MQAVPATEVARRAGHGVAVMLAVYANCIDGQDDAVNGGSSRRSLVIRTVRN
jgi:hypothetical protein